MHAASAPLPHSGPHMAPVHAPPKLAISNPGYPGSHGPSLPPGVLAQERRLLKVDMMSHSWAVTEQDFMKDPIYVPPTRLMGAGDGDAVWISIKQRPDGKLYARVEQILSKGTPDQNVPKTSGQPISQPSYAHSPSHPSQHPNQPYPNNQPQSGQVVHQHAPVKANSSSVAKHPPIWTPPSSSQPQNLSPSVPKPISNNPYPQSHGQQPRSSAQGQNYYPGNQNPYVPPSGGRSPSPNPYAQPREMPAQVQHSQSTPLHAPAAHHAPNNAPNNAASQVAPPRAVVPQSIPLVEGVLVMESPVNAYVVANESNQIVHIPREFLSGASNGEVVRVHVIPARSTHERLEGAILFRVGIHPSMSSQEPSAPEMPNDSSGGSYYPDLEHWKPSSASAPSDFISPQPYAAYPYQAASSPSIAASQSSHQMPKISDSPSSSQSRLITSYPVPGVTPANHVSYANAKTPIVPPQAVAQLKTLFSSKAKLHPPTLSYGEFASTLDSLGEVEALTRPIFEAVNRSGFRRNEKNAGAFDHMSFDSFSHFILETLIFGDEKAQLTFSFSILDPNDTGFITKEIIRIQTDLIFRLMMGLLLPVYLANASDISEYFWAVLDHTGKGHVTVGEYFDNVRKNRLGLLGMGLAQMPNYFPMSIPKRGLPVYPGHSSWPLVVQMMCALSRALRAVQDSPDPRNNHSNNNRLPNNASSSAISHGGAAPAQNQNFSGNSSSAPSSRFSPATQSQPGALPIASPNLANAEYPAQAFRQCNKFEIPTLLSQQNKLTFADYAPHIFKRIRELRGIDDAQYLYSLGVEQLIGNFLFGRLTSLAKEGSSGKSGQFFFTSHDGRFLIKTIARHERNTLYKMLPNYLNHLMLNPASLLVPICGMHDMDQLSVIVMGNVFNSPYAMDAAWDLKGSVVGRKSSPGSFVKKDLDFDRGFLFGKSANNDLARQIRLDAAFLRSNNIVDYSLFVGYHTLNSDEIATYQHRDLGPNPHPYFDAGLMSYDPATGAPKNELWFLGIIDILIQFGVFKKAENFVKSFIHDPQGISIIPPDQYCERFCNYLTSCIR